MIGCFELQASIEFLLEVGAREIAPVVQNLADRIAARGEDAKEIVHRLRVAGVSAVLGTGWVRTSPHFYISPRISTKCWRF